MRGKKIEDKLNQIEQITKTGSHIMNHIKYVLPSLMNVIVIYICHNSFNITKPIQFTKSISFIYMENNEQNNNEKK